MMTNHQTNQCKPPARDGSGEPLEASRTPVESLERADWMSPVARLRSEEPSAGAAASEGWAWFPDSVPAVSCKALICQRAAKQ
jgi:hypothetical protein